MAEMRNFIFFRHLKADSTSFIMHFRGEKLMNKGTGLSFYFNPLKDIIAEVPSEDREVDVIIDGKSKDYQPIKAQGVLTYKVADPLVLAKRVDFSIDLRRGCFLKKPIERIAQFLGQLAQQYTYEYLSTNMVQDILREGHSQLKKYIESGLLGNDELMKMGLEFVSLRISAVNSIPDLEKALEAPSREKIKQEADEASFARRALAVENERAIQENEMKNRIELAKREEELIEQNALNSKRQVNEEVENNKIRSEFEMTTKIRLAKAQAEETLIKMEAEAKRTLIESEAKSKEMILLGDAKAQAHLAIGEVKVRCEAQRMEAFGNLPAHGMYALAFKEFSRKLNSIEHLNLSSDSLTSSLQTFLKQLTSS